MPPVMTNTQEAAPAAPALSPLIPVYKKLSQVMAAVGRIERLVDHQAVILGQNSMRQIRQLLERLPDSAERRLRSWVGTLQCRPHLAGALHCQASSGQHREFGGRTPANRILASCGRGPRPVHMPRSKTALQMKRRDAPSIGG